MYLSLLLAGNEPRVVCRCCGDPTCVCTGLMHACAAPSSKLYHGCWWHMNVSRRCTLYARYGMGYHSKRGSPGCLHWESSWQFARQPSWLTESMVYADVVLLASKHVTCYDGAGHCAIALTIACPATPCSQYANVWPVVCMSALVGYTNTIPGRSTGSALLFCA